MEKTVTKGFRSWWRDQHVYKARGVPWRVKCEDRAERVPEIGVGARKNVKKLKTLAIQDDAAHIPSNNEWSGRSGYRAVEERHN